MEVWKLTVQLQNSVRLGYPTGWSASVSHSSIFRGASNITYTSMRKDTAVQALSSLRDQLIMTLEFKRLALEVDPLCLEEFAEEDNILISKWLIETNDS